MTFPKAWRLPSLLGIVVLSALLLHLWHGRGRAQVHTEITSDSSLGTMVNHHGSVHTITGGTRPGSGPNLLHSFGHFSVGAGDTARFASDVGIVNIIGRVTGGAPSMIDGTLQAEANLFLLNRQGIMFGENARLDINGSFHASTADVLRFADGAAFSTHMGEASTLTVATPSAFGFVHANPAGIAIEGSELDVPEGETLSIVGGNLTIAGDGDPTSGAANLSAPGGRIHLASVAAAGDIELDPTGWGAELDAGSLEQLGDIGISAGALIDVSGEGGGTVVIQGRRLTVEGDGRIQARVEGAGDSGGVRIEVKQLELSEGSQINTGTANGSSGRGGEISIIATDRITITSQDHDRGPTGLFTSTAGSGDAGAITVETGQLTLINGGRLDARAIAGGSGGIITITATNRVTLIGADRDGRQNRSRISSSTARRSSGHAGRVIVEAPDVVLGEQARIEVTSSGEGDAGHIAVKVERLTLTDGARIDAGAFSSSPGKGGTITVHATDAVRIHGADRTDNYDQSGLFTRNRSDRVGGGITVHTRRLTLTGGGQIASHTHSSGNGGAMILTADDGIIIGENTRPARCERCDEWPVREYCRPWACRCDYAGRAQGRSARWRDYTK